MAEKDTELFPHGQRNMFRLNVRAEADRFPRMTETIQDRVSRLIENSGKSPQRVSREAGLDKETLRKLLANPQQKPSAKTLQGLARVFGVSEDWLLNGERHPGQRDRMFIDTFDPDNSDTFDDSLWPSGDQVAAFFDGGLHYRGSVPGASPEIPAVAGAGQGHILDERTVAFDAAGLVQGHPVTSEWVIPVDFVRHNLDAAPSQIVLIPIIGHSMEPRLFAGDRVIVDLSQHRYSGDAIYVIDDGDEVMKAKTVSKVVGSSPPRFRIISEASPDRFDELNGEQFRIIGRVVGRFSRI